MSDIKSEGGQMNRKGQRVAVAAAAFALASFSAPAFAQTVDIICDVERHFEANGRPSDSRFVSQWRLSVDAETPRVTLVGVDGANPGTPPGQAWLIGTPAPTGRDADGSILACVIQSGRCGETLRYASFEQDTLDLNLSQDLSFMSLISTSLFTNGRTMLFDWRGPCRRV